MRIEVFDCSALPRRMAQPPPASSPPRAKWPVCPVRSRTGPEASPPSPSTIDPSNKSIQARTNASTEKASTTRISRLPSAGSAAITCAGSACSFGTSASGTKRCIGDCPGGVTRQTATAEGTPETANGSSAESSTPGVSEFFAGYHRCRRRNSGSADCARVSSVESQCRVTGSWAISAELGLVHEHRSGTLQRCRL